MNPSTPRKDPADFAAEYEINDPLIGGSPFDGAHHIGNRLCGRCQVAANPDVEPICWSCGGPWTHVWKFEMAIRGWTWAVLDHGADD